MNVHAYPAYAPKRNGYGGRTWDTIPVTLPNGVKVDAWIETTWGVNVYIFAPSVNEWYAIKHAGNAVTGYESPVTDKMMAEWHIDWSNDIVVWHGRKNPVWETK